jgi:hypothetical protein
MLEEGELDKLAPSIRHRRAAFPAGKAGNSRLGSPFVSVFAYRGGEKVKTMQGFMVLLM